MQSTNPLVFDLPEVIASRSKYPAKAIEGSRLNWKINLDDFVDRLGENDLAAIDLTKTLRLLADAKIK